MTGESSDAAMATIVATLKDVVNGNLRARVQLPEDAPASLSALRDGLNELIVAWRDSELRARKAKRALEEKVATIETQAVAIRELSVPIMEVWPKVLLVPLVGSFDQRRGGEVTSELLLRLAGSSATHVIVDLTGIDVVDESAADQLTRLVRSASLLGARCVITGISPAVAQIFVAIGASLADHRVKTHRSLQAGLRDCIESR
jgi:rsbT co-antagonist protein RsbR